MKRPKIDFKISSPALDKYDSDPRSKKFDPRIYFKNKTRNPIRLTFDHGSTPGKRPHCFDKDYLDIGPKGTGYMQLRQAVVTNFTVKTWMAGRKGKSSSLLQVFDINF